MYRKVLCVRGDRNTLTTYTYMSIKIMLKTFSKPQLHAKSKTANQCDHRTMEFACVDVCMYVCVFTWHVSYKYINNILFKCPRHHSEDLSSHIIATSKCLG